MWSDDDLDGTQGVSEAALAEFAAFLDLDEDGVQDAAEPGTQTDATPRTSCWSMCT